MIRDVGRLITLLDVMYYVGDLLLKRSLRYTGFTAAVSLVGYLGNFLPGIDTYNARVAIALPLLVGAVTLSTGAVLKMIPSVIASRRLVVAEAGDLDLMEDYRKLREEIHLETLWQRIYRHEWAAGSAVSRIHPHPIEAPPAMCYSKDDDPCERGRQEYFERARYALARPQPQPRHRYHLGLDLRFLEDWRNGAYFHRNDTKLVEQFEASATLEAIRSELGLTRWSRLHELPCRLHQKFWIVMITRAMGTRIGDAVIRLNHDYRTDWFNAQALLWPGEDRQEWLEQFPRAREEVGRYRRLILDEVFGKDDAAARKMLERMLLPTFWLATQLRIEYDPEYLDGTLGFDLVGDLREMGIPPERIAPYEDLARQTCVHRESLRTCLTRFRPEILEPENLEELRAAWVAVHLNRHQFGPILIEQAAATGSLDSFVEKVLAKIDQAIRDRAVITSRLVALRMHHELTRLHHREYIDLLAALRKEE